MDETLYHRFLAVERAHWWFRARRAILVSIANRLVPPGGALLDFGCGTGFFLEALPADREACGVDFSETAVRMGRERGLARVRHGTPTDLSAVEGRSFDLVTLLDVIEHLDDDVAALRRVHGLLKPGGRVLVTVPAYAWMWSRHDDLNHHRRRYTRPRLRAALEAAGFEVGQATYYNCLLFPLAWAVRSWRRWTRDTEADEFALPSPPVNALLHALFLSERAAISARVPLPFGLSVLAIGRKAGGDRE